MINYYDMAQIILTDGKITSTEFEKARTIYFCECYGLKWKVVHSKGKYKVYQLIKENEQ
jgi:hypothetical protein